MQQADLSKVSIDNQEISIPEAKLVYLEKENGNWKISKKPEASEKGPHRNGSFKDAFRNNVVFVYASKGSKNENEWYYNRAKFDAEKFYYRANGSVDIVKDTDFKASDFPDRNVIIYGNKSNNAAWRKVLNHAPVQVSNNQMQIGEKIIKGENLGAYFIYPRADSEIASVGVVTATGEEGMYAAYANDYLVNGTFFPDIMIFDNTMGKEGLKGVLGASFFGNDWSVKNGFLKWKKIGE
ncbi:hypothetical protein LZ575_18520 [Antarcticibacterium sp. 1MA-6-2]|uniref:hypothetical protein n=1 Tax=Antarcticibacterium sp. 1MA-6-2 TaxID=2908210 RepID=UPI001F2E10C4|nr:hypothetical protein [Antarcticibacterium sp. 1MA-6-2]UJH90732.1 hypothetical protein LZ575_18520 [Antarcticibacterium sp. 1MA-6-2]